MFVNLKCEFISASTHFLEFIVSSEGVLTYPDKVKAIRDRPTLITIHEVRSFYRLATLYRSS